VELPEAVHVVVQEGNEARAPGLVCVECTAGTYSDTLADV
jgi:hypothetical protein